MTPDELLHALRVARVAQKLNQKQMAEKLGITTQTLCRWETGTNFPTLDALVEWCSLLGLSLEWKNQ